LSREEEEAETRVGSKSHMDELKKKAEVERCSKDSFSFLFQGRCKNQGNSNGKDPLTEDLSVLIIDTPVQVDSLPRKLKQL